MNSTEQNQLIAEFMGAKMKSFVEGYAGTFYYLNGKRWVQPDSLKYHTSWDWLMPVVEKIEDCKVLDDFGFSVIIDNWQVNIRSCFSGQNVVFVSSGQSKIAVVHSAIIQFITWYNSQPKTPNNGTD